MSQIKDGDNLVSLILAKTLLRLDAVFHAGESQNFLRSPLTFTNMDDGAIGYDC